jgi:hypothetical protein
VLLCLIHFRYRLIPTSILNNDEGTILSAYQWWRDAVTTGEGQVPDKTSSLILGVWILHRQQMKAHAHQQYIDGQ